MSAIHTALKALCPIAFSDIPTEPTELDHYISDLFLQSQLIVESIPIVEPAAKDVAQPGPIVASSAAEIKPSIARSAQPAEEYASLQKEWGKPIKLGAKENALGMSVYKLSGKDGKGAWFARRSVHEGLGFAKFKRSMQHEFEESLAVHGAPGEGNVRGIGGEERVENVDVPGKGKMEVYRLSAQFPGPTTPRDFVTLLITSDNAMTAGSEPRGIVPRHYMVISKPCDHPDTQPADGFIRGSYESVEFIREVPRNIKTSMSTTDLETLNSKDEDNVSKAAVLRNAQQHSGGLNPRERSITAPQHPTKSTIAEKDESESNPVEWIMVTRSDPGGSVPRFMVERGTPSSICQDASKFLDWACQQDANEEENQDLSKRPSVRRESFQSFRSSRLAGLQADSTQNEDTKSTEREVPTTDSEDKTVSSGLVNTVVGAVSAYTPQVVLDHLPGHTDTKAESQKNESITAQDDDTKSILSTTSFQSAEDHLSSGESDIVSETSKLSQDNHDNKAHSQHEKELHKLEQRRVALESKFADSRSKLNAQITDSTAKEEAAHKKALEKHDKEVKKHEEKYRKEVQKLEERQRKERQKLEEKRKKQQDKNEQARLTRERDEARRDADLARQETEMLRDVVAELQRENTALVAKLGKVAGGKGVEAVKADVTGHVRSSSGSSRRVTIGSSHSTLSQSSSIEHDRDRLETSIAKEPVEKEG